MKDKALCDLENQFEADMIAQILEDQGISFRIEFTSENYWGVILGEGAKMFKPYARLWGYVKDKDIIGDLLTKMRNAEIFEEK